MLPFPEINNSLNRSICGSKLGAGCMDKQRKRSREVTQGDKTGGSVNVDYMNDLCCFLRNGADSVYNTKPTNCSIRCSFFISELKPMSSSNCVLKLLYREQ